MRDGKVVGIVSRSNLIQALASSSQAKPAHEADRKIRVELLSRLGDQNWTDFGARNLIVTDGVVHHGDSSAPRTSGMHSWLLPKGYLASSEYRMN
jgi:hypothetical protein